MRTLSVVLALLALAPVARADADSLGDPLGPREVAVGEGLRAGATGALATTLNPAGLPLTRELVFEGSFGYRPDDSASLIGVSACDSTNAVPGCFYYRYAGASSEIAGMEIDRRTHVGGLTLSRPIGSRVLLGVGGKYYDTETKDGMDDAGDGSGFAYDAGATVRLTDLVNLAVVGYNLLDTGTSEFPRAVAGGLYLKPSPELAFGFDGLWNLDRDEDIGRYGGGGEYFLSTSEGRVGYPLRAGVVHDVATGTYVTGGLGVTTLKVALDVGARKQVSDGDELLVTASLRVFGPRM